MWKRVTVAFVWELTIVTKASQHSQSVGYGEMKILLGHTGAQNPTARPIIL
jgi:hypothetical protein